MAKLRFLIALVAAKFAKFAIKLMGRNASHNPGVIALKICPDFLKLAPKAPLVICVTGTNGKTTVSNLLTDAFMRLMSVHQGLFSPSSSPITLLLQTSSATVLREMLTPITFSALLTHTVPTQQSLFLTRTSFALHVLRKTTSVCSTESVKWLPTSRNPSTLLQTILSAPSAVHS